MAHNDLHDLSGPDFTPPERGYRRARGIIDIGGKNADRLAADDISELESETRWAAHYHAMLLELRDLLEPGPAVQLISTKHTATCTFPLAGYHRIRAILEAI